MTQKSIKKQVSLSLIALFSVLIVADSARNIASSFSSNDRIRSASLTKELHDRRLHFSAQKQEEKKIPASLQNRTARLQKRLIARGYNTIPLASIAQAVADRQKLLSYSGALEISRIDTPSASGTSMRLSLQEHSNWIKPTITPFSVSFTLDTDAIAQSIEEYGLPGFPPPRTSTLTSHIKERRVERVVSDQAARDGFTFDQKQFVDDVANAFHSGTEHVQVAVEYVPGKVINNTGLDLGPLDYLGKGHSDFAGSIDGRIANVNKGLNERINNIIIPPHSVFSFQDTLGVVTEEEGWQKALGIFGGGGVAMVVGGGLCQVATTVYRAAVHTGRPVVERKNHSLYVSYYEKHGVGIDATIYKELIDLRFENDTDEYMLLQAYTDGFEAFVNVYGKSDGRKVTLEGPYFAANSPAAFVGGRRLSFNEIGWIQKITFADGTVKRNTIISRYKEVPGYVSRKYVQAGAQLHAAAENLASR